MIENNVRRERSRLGMTQADFAAGLPDNLDAIGVGYIEKGRVLPTPGQLDGMCQMFHCERTDLYDESDIDLLSVPGPELNDDKEVRMETVGDARGHKGKVEFRAWLRPVEKDGLVRAVVELGYRSNAEWLREMIRNTVARNKRLHNRGA